MTNAFTYVQKHGIPLEENYPYKGRTKTCKSDIKGEFFQISSWKSVPQSANAWVKAVYQQPLAIGIDADGIMFYSSGVFYSKHCGDSLNHGVLLVGYGTSSKGKPFWKVKNSWGGRWGESGYIRFERDMSKSKNVCGILEEAEYPIA